MPPFTVEDYFEVWWSKIAYSCEESFSKAVFFKGNLRAIPDVKQFVRFLTKFNGSGGIGECKPKHNVKDSFPQPDIDAV